MHLSVTTLIANLKAAIAHDRGAKAEALQRGLAATQPLSLVRLGELCALGDRMARSSAVRDQALVDLQLALGTEWEPGINRQPA
jgi:hypothetical protein